MFEKFAEDIEKRYWQKLSWMANKNNYTHGTSANFSPTSRPDRKPDFTSKSNSEYWNTPMGVIRGSDHWGTVGSCDWKLGKNKFPKKKVYGFSPWENFEKKPEGMKKMSSKKVLRNWDKLSPEEQQAIQDSLSDRESIYLDTKPIGRGYEGSAYRVLTKDLGEAIRKNFDGSFGETPHIDRMIELKGDAIDQVVRDLVAQNKYQEAHDLYIGENPRRDISQRLGPRLQIFKNPDNQDFLATLSKVQPRRVHENIGGGIRGKDLIHGGVIMEKLKVQDDSSGFTEADFAALNSDLANRILKAHVGDKPAFGTDFPEKFETPNGKIGPNMRFAPILRGADGKLYQIKDLRNVYDPSVLPEKFREHETAFHNIGIDSNGKLKLFDFGAREIE